jgi:hypothetical protein
VTRYGYDAAHRALITLWGTGRGDVAAAIAELPSMTDDQALDLARQLTFLSQCAWRTYTHPANSAGDPEQANSEAWRRAQELSGLASVQKALRAPNLPSNDGTMLVSYSPLVESAHRIGRLLHAVGDSSLVERVVAEALREQQAIEAAECGELSGRARQAVECSRADASPVQVQAAYAVLHADPLGSMDLFTDLDPAASAVAAAHWLQAAAEVVAETCGYDTAEVVMRADDIEALPTATPTFVLEQLADGDSPREVIRRLIADAMAAAEGRVRNPLRVLESISTITHTAMQLAPDDEALRAKIVTDSEPQISLLDPTRPAVDLLEDLLSGIHGCWLLYEEETSSAITDELDIDSDDEFDQVEQQNLDRAQRQFADAMRAEADANKDRLD